MVHAKNSLHGSVVLTVSGAMVTVRHGKKIARDHVFCPRAGKSIPVSSATEVIMSSGPSHRMEVCISGCGQSGFSCLPNKRS